MVSTPGRRLLATQSVWLSSKPLSVIQIHSWQSLYGLIKPGMTPAGHRLGLFPGLSAARTLLPAMRSRSGLRASSLLERGPGITSPVPGHLRLRYVFKYGRRSQQPNCCTTPDPVSDAGLQRSPSSSGGMWLVAKAWACSVLSDCTY